MKLERLIKKDIEPYIPQVALPAARYVHRIARRVRFWCVDLRDSMRPKRLDSIPLPPASLRYRVHGSNIDKFLDAGKRCSEDIKTSLERFGKDLDSFHDVLDFGCGCGRTIIWFADRSRSRNLHGTDIDAEAISWCRNNLDFAEFDVNDPLPPLHYASEISFVGWRNSSA
jgi:SAM-dependent methyltransferase